MSLVKQEELKEVIESYGGIEVDPYKAYDIIFNLIDEPFQYLNETGGLYKSNPIGIMMNNLNNKPRIYKRIMFNDTFKKNLEELQQADFAIMNGITYFGRNNTLENASKMYAMIFDLDGITATGLNNLLGGSESIPAVYPKPTLIVLSGNNAHLYYVFNNPISLYPDLKRRLNQFKIAMTDVLWNSYTSTEPVQHQSINQGFRVIGGKCKEDDVVTRAFWLDYEKCSFDYLNQFVSSNVQVDPSVIYQRPEGVIPINEALKKYEGWSPNHNERPRKTFIVNRALYDKWLQDIYDKKYVRYGNRYFSVMLLAIYAIKCDITYKELKEDAYKLVPFLNALATSDPFTKNDVDAALKCYKDSYITFPNWAAESIIGCPIGNPIPRNGRPQNVHLARIRGAQQIEDQMNGTNWRDGNGRKPKDKIVRDWILAHPNQSKSQCIKDTDLAKATVYRWWNLISS